MSAIDSLLLKELQEGKPTAIKMLYGLAYDSCSKMILANTGSNKDARDFFKESLLLFIKKLQVPNTFLSAPPKVYLYSICRNLWLKHLQSTASNPNFVRLIDPDTSFPLIELDDLYPTKKVNPKYEILDSILNQLDVECKQLLVSFYFKKMSLKDIGESMNSNPAFIKVKKKRCMDNLKQKVLDRSNSQENTSSK